VAVAQRFPLDQFAANLRSARLGRKLSQEQLGFACQLHRTEVSLLERGGREPRLTTILKLAEALAIDPCALFANMPKTSD
jgi:transcriptional regulator with XRE-family HTH domain